MKNLRYFFLALTLWTVQDACAQEDFREGFVVLHNGDTLYGGLEYRSNSKNYESARFRRNGSVRELGPSDISAYGFIRDKVYTSSVADSLFAEILVNGDIDLYKLLTFYIVRKEGKLYKLESPEETVTVNGKEYYQKSVRWKGVLSSLLHDCLNNSAAIIKRIDLNETSLTNVVSRYNRCRNPDSVVVYKEDKPVTYFEFGLRAGVLFSRLVTNDQSQNSDLPENYSSLDPVLGMDVLFMTPRISERLGVIAGVQFTWMRYAARVEVQEPGRNNIYDSYINLNLISLPIGLNFQHKSGDKLKWFASAGVQLDFLVDSYTRMEIERIFDSRIFNEADREVFPLNRNQQGFWLRTGIRQSVGKVKGIVWIRYARMSSLTSSRDVSTHHNQLSLGVTVLR